MRLSIFAVLAIAIAGCTATPANRDPSTPLTTEQNVDLERYQGLWYEIARLPNSFEKDCEGVTAEYALRDDGKISVVNTCRKNSVDGKVKVANGRARIVNEKTNAELKVSFFGPFWGDYWILDLDDDYTLSLVGEPKGRYLWILSRTPTVADDVLADAIAKLDAFGYSTDALYFPQQPPAEAP